MDHVAGGAHVVTAALTPIWADNDGPPTPQNVSWMVGEKYTEAFAAASRLRLGGWFVHCFVVESVPAQPFVGS